MSAVFLGVASHESIEIWREFLELIPSDVVALIDGPSGQDPAEPAILLRIVEQRNAGLAELAEHRRGIEGSVAGVGAGDDDAGSGIENAGPSRAAPLADVARVVMEQGGQGAIDEHAARELIAFLSSKTLAEGVPALAVVGQSIGGLGDARLEDIAVVGARIDELVPGDTPFVARRQWALIFLHVVGGHEVGNDPKNALGDFVAEFFVLRIDLGFGGIRRSCWGRRRSGSFRLRLG